MRLDEGRFPALELNNRRLSVKNSFCRKNGIYTRSVAITAIIHTVPINCGVQLIIAFISWGQKVPLLRHIGNSVLSEFPLAIRSVACDADRNY